MLQVLEKLFYICSAFTEAFIISGLKGLSPQINYFVSVIASG